MTLAEALATEGLASVKIGCPQTESSPVPHQDVASGGISALDAICRWRARADVPLIC
jgi:hypothetical protein